MPLHLPLSRRRALGALAVAWLNPLFLRPARAQAAGATIHFYSPETNINNFGTLKAEFDGFFAGMGGHKFQPYGDRAAFDSMRPWSGGSCMTKWGCFRSLKNSTRSSSKVA